MWYALSKQRLFSTHAVIQKIVLTHFTFLRTVVVYIFSPIGIKLHCGKCPVSTISFNVSNLTLFIFKYTRIIQYTLGWFDNGALAFQNSHLQSVTFQTTDLCRKYRMFFSLWVRNVQLSCHFLTFSFFLMSKVVLYASADKEVIHTHLCA